MVGLVTNVNFSFGRKRSTPNRILQSCSYKASIHFRRINLVLHPIKTFNAIISSILPRNDRRTVLKQIESLLRLRILQAYRYLAHIGFGLIVFALIILAGMLFSILGTVLEIPAKWAILAAGGLLIGIEIRRPDKFFLISVFDSYPQYWCFKFLEGILIASPILIFQSIFLRWDIVIGTLATIAVVSIIPFYRLRWNGKERKRSIHFIPLSLFETRFYFEKNWFGVLIIVLLLFLGVLHISLWILGMVFIVMLPIEIFTPHESREMIHFESGFVKNKIFKNLAFFLAVVIIPTLACALSSPSYMFVFIYVVYALILALSLAISKKYNSYYGLANYWPSSKSTMILTLLMLAPGGILITNVAAVYYYIKAENHIKSLYAGT